jgi:hypothetical protein
MLPRAIFLIATATGCGRLGFEQPFSDARGSDDASSPSVACGSAPSCPSFALLCDSFEGTVDTSTWGIYTQNATLQSDAGTSCRGSAALHASTQAIASGTATASLSTRSFPFARTTLFVRAYLLIPSATAPDASSQVWWFLQADQTIGSSYGVEVDDRGGQVHVTNFEPQSMEQSSSQTWPLDTWVCVEWDLVFPSADTVSDGAAWLRIDEALAPSLDPFGGLTLPSSTQPIDRVQLGLGVYGSPVPLGAAEIWLDDLVIANQRISCAD